ncbi:odorant receptor 13a-like [Microplitis mediator]|uniref:odorant receptor 13a-like n=1 Tax=Microplitis mediator TaxID=375433 RepID=UPI002556D12C|nr:odorant receptor 13a-like [Microplitis mediator]
MEDLTQEQRDLNEGAKMFDWGKWISKGIGVWPLAPNDYLFTTTFIYFTAVMMLECVDLYTCLGDFEKVIDNLTENLAFVHIYVRTLMLRVHIDKLRDVMSESLKDYRTSAFKNSTEIKLFMTHINKGKLFAKVVITFIAMTEVTWYLQPLTTPSPSVDDRDNETISILLPYHFYVFYKINDFKTYVLTYLSHGPHVVISGFGHATSDCFLIILVFHLSGRLAVLAERINALKNKSEMYKTQVKSIIAEHIRLLKMGENIRSAFATALLAYLFNGTILLCMIGYQILVNFMTGPNSDLMQYFIFIFATYFIITVFCIVSERLIFESTKVCEAYWNCGWYNMPQDCVKDIIYCIRRSQKPLALQAGKFAYFGNSTLTDVTRTAMGYLSVLRNFLIVN